MNEYFHRFNDRERRCELCGLRFVDYVAYAHGCEHTGQYDHLICRHSPEYRQLIPIGNDVYPEVSIIPPPQERIEIPIGNTRPGLRLRQ